MAQYDYTNLLAPYLDLHLVFPLLEFLAEKNIYEKEKFDVGMREMLLKTNMIDSVIESYKPETAPNYLLKRREKVIAERDHMAAVTEPIIAILKRPEVKQAMNSPRDGNNEVYECAKTFGFTDNMLGELIKYAKILFECGSYSAASIFLYYYLNLFTNDERYLSALYGKLASEILDQAWELAQEDLDKLRAVIDVYTFDSDAELLTHRAWLLHYSLFVFFNTLDGTDQLIDLFTNQKYLNAIQILCPHLLRYLAVAVVKSKSKQKSGIKEIVKVIEVEQHNFKDPITEFIAALYIRFDFEEAEAKLSECEQVLDNDFFLTGCKDFIKSARMMIYELFCKSHGSIRLEDLATSFDLSMDNIETFLNNEMAELHLEGIKVDSEEGVLKKEVKDNRYDLVIQNRVDELHKLHENLEASLKRISAQQHNE